MLERWPLSVQSFSYSGQSFLSQNPKDCKLTSKLIQYCYNQIVGMMIHVADLRFNGKTREVSRGKKSIHLTRQELKLLQLLMENKNKSVTRQEILNHIWHAPGTMKTRIVDVYIGYLRKKIDHGFEKKLIKTNHGTGYMISS